MLVGDSRSCVDRELPEIESVTRSICNALTAQSLNANQDNCRYLGTIAARKPDKTFNFGSYAVSKRHNFSIECVILSDKNPSGRNNSYTA